ncbi:hemin-degrading factor [Sphingobacterium hungaricum]|uniref:Hemin-degrading factor n=1 Tax=Sphingobacterium hungaricum TaxID=2082723 RepID=A0A928UVL8_9SPHI|nr:ChuX/HutX family heme-like substrate-binding protein [Sphingobacterium hungaricum]MBE8713768.1 hemin-degrading factor [Sphingobacterium hungaricum]
METTLKENYDTFKLENPKVRIRDAAKTLGVSEAELVATNPDNILLNSDIEGMLKQIKDFGYVMALTRNEDAVHERKGTYTKATFNAHVGLVVNPDIDLRLFMYNWKYAFAVNENNRKSIQFFDTRGEAIHKIYLTEKSDEQAYQLFIDQFKADPAIELSIDSNPKAVVEETPDNEIDVESFQKEWLGLTDTHNFFGILKKHAVSRRQSMRLAPANHAIQIPVADVEKLLNTISDSDAEIMIFIGNKNMIQIHTGKAKKIVRTGPWINILDEEFNMHLRDEAIESLWIVKKPTDLGLVHSVEAYDKEGNLIVQFFGKRKPNIPEREDWRGIIQTLEN